MPFPDPVILVPGVTATYLRDHYPLPPEVIWSVLKNDFDRARLHPDDVRFEAAQPALVRPDQVYEIAYRELVEELRYNLADRPDRPVPVFPFGYDWRHPVQVTQARLGEFIDEVIERTKLLRHYHPDYASNPRVNLVGHSMGGMVIAGYVEHFGADKINKVATLATPFRGSFEAIVKMATGTASIGGSNPSSREREAARVTPSLYNLLPDFEIGIVTDPADGLPRSTFDPDLWQPTIIDSVIEYVYRFSRDSTSRDKAAAAGPELFRRLLADSAEQRRRINGLDLAAKGLDPGSWLCVIGAGSETRVRMNVKRRGTDPQFILTSDDRLDQWNVTDVGTALNSGDGTVPVRGAIPPFLPREAVVCVTPDDYGYWEIQDRATTRLAGFHGILPNMDLLRRILVRFFAGKPDPKGNTWGRALPGVAQRDWEKATPLPLKWKPRTEA